MPITPTEPGITISVNQLYTIIGSCLSAIVALMALIWSLVIERLKKCESRLDEGNAAFTEIMVEQKKLGTEQVTLIEDVNHHLQESNAYRHANDVKLGEVEIKVEKQISKCLEKNCKGVPS